MLIDSSLELADAETVHTANNAAPFVVGSVDLRGTIGIGDNATVDLSAGESLFAVIEVTTAIAGTATSEFSLHTHTADIAKGTVSTAATEIWRTALVAGNRVAGKRWIVSLPEAAYARYLLVAHRNDNSGAPSGGGAINCYLTKDVTNWTGTADRVPATDPAT